MVNIISNSCVGSYITSLFLNQRFVNPFCWNVIYENSFQTLIEEYKTINFEKIELKKRDKKYALEIDGKVSVYYSHYIEDPNQQSILKKNSNVYYKDIKDYIIEKYYSRLQLNDSPIFIAGSSYDNGLSKKDYYQKLINANKNKYRLIIIVDVLDDFKSLKELENEYTKIFYTDIKEDNKALAFEIFKAFKDFLV